MRIHRSIYDWPGIVQHKFAFCEHRDAGFDC